MLFCYNEFCSRKAHITALYNVLRLTRASIILPSFFPVNLIKNLAELPKFKKGGSIQAEEKCIWGGGGGAFIELEPNHSRGKLRNTIEQ
jgi:hypothetical protein